MAYQGKFISNPKTGQSYLFLQTAQSTGGKLLEMESAYASMSTEPPMHYHPYQTEDFIILEGELTVYMNGKKILLHKGERLHIPANTVHAMWNASHQITKVNWKIMPALASEFLFENFTGLANDNKTDEQGKPAFLQSILLLKKFSKEFRMAKPPYGVMKILCAILAPIAGWRGYKANMEQYIN
jgi:quercetin dioxygenase-like cupin family protein